MRNYLFAAMLAFASFSCKDKKAPAGEEKAAMNDFVKAFPVIKLPFTISDTSLNDHADTTTLNYDLLTQFVPDSTFKTHFGKDRKLTFYPLGRFGDKNKETYLSVLAKAKDKAAVYLFVLTRKNIFSASMPLLLSENNNETINSATVDSRLTVTLQKEWKKNEELLFDRSVYTYNNAGVFTVVMTETNDQSKVAVSINNPFDTFPKKNKYSGDYLKSKLNFLTVRDGKKPDSYVFFVHFENEGDDPCNGELKGEFIMNTPTSGIFTESGGSCVIDFSFTVNQAKVKEQGNCGSHRGIKCFFNDTYTKKKVPKIAGKELKTPKKK